MNTFLKECVHRASINTFQTRKYSNFLIEASWRCSLIDVNNSRKNLRSYRRKKEIKGKIIADYRYEGLCREPMTFPSCKSLACIILRSEYAWGNCPCCPMYGLRPIRSNVRLGRRDGKIRTNVWTKEATKDNSIVGYVYDGENYMWRCGKSAQRRNVCGEPFWV